MTTPENDSGPAFPGWVTENCHCCAGISWGGDYPQECPDCKGGGTIWIHTASGRVAAWPGGPFLGSRARAR